LEGRRGTSYRSTENGLFECWVNEAKVPKSTEGRPSWGAKGGRGRKKVGRVLQGGRTPHLLIGHEKKKSLRWFQNGEGKILVTLKTREEVKIVL